MKTSTKSKVVKGKAAKRVAPKSSKKPTPRKKPVEKKATVFSFGKHVHPYGTAHHPDRVWHSTRLQERLGQLNEADRAEIEKAIAFAVERHDGQYRKGGGDAVIHPIRIANILMYEWSATDSKMIAAALLHDVVEDTQTTLKEIKDAFGNDVGKLVDGMTMWKGSETYETYVKRVSRGSEVLRMIKCADSLDNLRSWYETSGEEFPRWWRNNRELILPMAQTVDDGGMAALAIAKVLDDPWYLKQAGMED
jgi:hypothetical protein